MCSAIALTAPWDCSARELMIRKGELEEQLFFSSLERIFIEERIYKERKFEQSKSQDEVVAFIDSKLEPFKDKLFTAEVDGKGHGGILPSIER